MTKKYLRKNEFRVYHNPNNPNDKENDHPAFITAKKGHSFKRNSITHSHIIDDVENITMDENPNKNRKFFDTRKTRVGFPSWKNEHYFGEPLKNWRWSRKNNKRIRKANKKYFKTGIWK